MSPDNRPEIKLRAVGFTQDLQQQLFAGDPETAILLYDHSGRDVLDQVASFHGHGLNRT